MMLDLQFGRDSMATIPSNRRVRVIVFTATLLLHVILFTALGWVRAHPVRVSSDTTTHVGIAAYMPGATGTAGTSAPTTAPVPPRKALTAHADKTTPQEDQSDAGQSAGAPGTPGGGQVGSGPVRLGSGGNLTLLTKITPVYPRMMEMARMSGVVVLDAIIHRDGTIGDVTVLKSTNTAFVQSAVDAVKQWRYTPIPYEGIVTVTVNFTLPG